MRPRAGGKWHEGPFRFLGVQAPCADLSRHIAVLHAADVSGTDWAMSIGGTQAVMRNSPEMSRICPELAAAASLGSIDVLATRIWLDRIVPTDTPANVFSQFSELRGAGTQTHR